MEKPVVSVMRYESSPGSLKTALEAVDGFRALKPGMRILIKPNLVGWDPIYPIAPYGVYTSSRLVEDMVILLKEYGATEIAVGEGSAPRGAKLPNHLRGTKLIFKALGYDYLKERYGVKLIDFFDEPFRTVEFDTCSLDFAQSALDADFVINMPVLKTHNQTTLSLGLKNLKGCIDLKSRRLCHHAHLPLDSFCALFAEAVRPGLTILDGIYGLEKGPYYLGTAHRMNLIVASRDPLAVDVVGSIVAGYEPDAVEHVSLFAKRANRSVSPEDFTIKGLDPFAVQRPLKCDFNWREDNSGPRSWDKLGITNLSIPKYDQTICTGCSSLYNPLLMLLTAAYSGKQHTARMEVVTGKRMEPSPGFEKTILFGNCMIKKNRKHPNVKQAVCIKGCPVTMEEVIGRLSEIGLEPDLDYFARFRGKLAHRYDGNPDFEPDHYFMPGAAGRPGIAE